MSALYELSDTAPFPPGTERALNPLDFGAIGDGVTTDDVAFTALLAKIPSGGEIYIPRNKNFLLTQPLVLPTATRLRGGGYRSILTNNTTDIIAPVGTNLYWHISDVQLVAGASGGHCINVAGALAQSAIDNVTMKQTNPAKSAINAAGWVDVTVANCWIVGQSTAARTTPLIYGLSTTNNLSDNEFRDLVITDAGGSPPTTWAIWWEENSATTAVGNRFRGINFENCPGGAITVRGQSDYVIDCIQLWDTATTTTNHLVYPAKAASGQANHGGLIRKVFRTTGTRGTGLRDICLGGVVGSEFGTTICDCYGIGAGASSFAIDMQLNIGCRIDRCYGALSISNYSPSLAVQSGAGTGATASFSTGDLYTATLILNTGTGAAAGNLVAVTYSGSGWMNHAPSGVLLQPMDATTAAAGLYVTSVSAAGFTIAAANALPSSTSGLKLAYRVVQDLTG